MFSRLGSAGNLPRKKGARVFSAAVRSPFCKAFVAVVSTCWMDVEGVAVGILLFYSSSHSFPSRWRRRSGAEAFGQSIECRRLRRQSADGAGLFCGGPYDMPATATV